MRDHGAEAAQGAAVRAATLDWVHRHLDTGERIVGAEALTGGITSEMRRLTVRTRDGHIRELVLRTVVDTEDAEECLVREAGALSVLPGSGVPAPALVAADPSAALCEHPSLLMTHLPGRTVLDDAGLEERVPLLARQLVAIHALPPSPGTSAVRDGPGWRPQEYERLTTASTVVIPEGARTAAWAAAVDVVRGPAPGHEDRFLHGDFHPGNVLFDVPPGLPPDVPPPRPEGARITGVVDWTGACRGPADLDVAHCSSNLALLHGPAWGLRFAEAYEEAGGVLAAAASERLYWLVRDALAFSEEVQAVSRPWREAGRTELTARAVEERLDAYITALTDTLG